MQDAGIARDVLNEAGIHLTNGRWGSAVIMEMAHGVARFGQKLEGGFARLRELLGASVRVRDWGCGGGAACAPPVQVLLSWELWFPPSFALGDVAGFFVHELGHIIDWNAHYSFSSRWGYPPLTDYAAGQGQPYPISWDRWAEAVAVWVMGDFAATGAFATTHRSTEVGRHTANLPAAGSLVVQMNRISELLNGWR